MSGKIAEGRPFARHFTLAHTNRLLRPQFSIPEAAVSFARKS